MIDFIFFWLAKAVVEVGIAVLFLMGLWLIVWAFTPPERNDKEWWK